MEKIKIKNLNKKIDLYRDEIIKRNYENFKSFAFGGLVITGCIASVGIVFWDKVHFSVVYCLYFGHFVLCNLFIHLFLKNNTKYTLWAFYFAMIPILFIGILMGTFLDPNRNAITIMILLCTLFMFITDKPLNIIMYILGTSFIFLASCYSVKTTSIFIGDVVNLVIYLSIGISVNMLTLKDRVASVENYVLTKKLADSDTLTNILNRGAGDKIVKHMLENNQSGAFIIIDIDDFKHVNDTYGHQIGDEVIQIVSKQLKNVFRNKDIVWRLGGDEFAVFALGLVDVTMCKLHFKQLQEGLKGIKFSSGSIFDVEISMGCCICNGRNNNFDDIYKNSDDALYQAKHLGKNTYFIKE